LSPGPSSADTTARTATARTATDRPLVLADVASMIAEIVGEDYLLDLEIGMDTSFSDDLELESIEFVTLAEKLTERYGERVDFVAWLAETELDDLIAMTVGTLVTFVAASLDAS